MKQLTLLALVAACSGTIPSEPRDPMSVTSPEPKASLSGFLVSGQRVDSIVRISTYDWDVQAKDSQGRNIWAGSGLDYNHPCSEGWYESVTLASPVTLTYSGNLIHFSGHSEKNVYLLLLTPGDDYCTLSVISKGTAEYTVDFNQVDKVYQPQSLQVDLKGDLDNGQKIRVQIRGDVATVTYR